MPQRKEFDFCIEMIRQKFLKLIKVRLKLSLSSFSYCILLLLIISQLGLTAELKANAKLESDKRNFTTSVDKVDQVSSRQLKWSPRNYYSEIIMGIVKFLLRQFFTPEWTAEIAIKRLDTLKTNIINYYTTRVDLEARDSGVGFPSLEGALLSLAFLTFSVFLIDFIQILLNKLKMKQAATPTAAPARRPVNRRRRPVFVAGREGFIPESEEEDFIARKINDAEALTTLSSKVSSAIEKPLSATTRSVWSH